MLPEQQSTTESLVVLAPLLGRISILITMQRLEYSNTVEDSEEDYDFIEIMATTMLRFNLCREKNEA